METQRKEEEQSVIMEVNDDPDPFPDCEGCIHDYGNQQGHMGPGGCLEPKDVRDEGTEKLPDCEN